MFLGNVVCDCYIPENNVADIWPLQDSLNHLNEICEYLKWQCKKIKLLKYWCISEYSLKAAEAYNKASTMSIHQ